MKKILIIVDPKSDEMEKAHNEISDFKIFFYEKDNGAYIVEDMKKNEVSISGMNYKRELDGHVVEVKDNSFSIDGKRVYPKRGINEYNLK